MADTIITNTPPGKNGEDSGGAGWVVAIIILIAVIVGGYVLFQNGAFNQAAPAAPGNTNINVTVPAPVTPAPKAPGTTNP